MPGWLGALIDEVSYNRRQQRARELLDIIGVTPGDLERARVHFAEIVRKYRRRLASNPPSSES